MFEIVKEQPSKWHPGRVRHIVKNGARYHVVSWVRIKDKTYEHCSEPNCELNLEYDSRGF
jgi:hypothetical protein